MTRTANVAAPVLQPTAKPTKPNPALHIEVCVPGVDADEETLGPKVAKWLEDNYVTLEPSQAINLPNNLQYPIQSIQVADVTGRSSGDQAIALTEIDLIVHIFRLHDNLCQTRLFSSLSSPDNVVDDGDQSLPQAKVVRLPSREIHGVWEFLTFNEPIHVRLLHTITRMMSFAARQVTARTIVWNRLVLLYGPPGTGKTSLCRALAQKLSIRLGKQYRNSKLIEVDSHSLFSKFFGESGKLVGLLFEEIERLLEQEKDTFICILIDEVESLTSARDQVAGHNEPRDGLRAVNALLTALDRLRCRPNVVVLCTSNLIEAMDSAFLDRVDIKQHIPYPCATARYEIYRLCYLELAQSGLIAQIQDNEEDTTNENGDVDNYSPSTVTSATQWHDLGETLLPKYDMMQLYYFRDRNPNAAARKLWDIAEKSEVGGTFFALHVYCTDMVLDDQGLSGRTLRRLPALAIAMYTTSDPCPIEEALAALSRAVEDERESRVRSGKEA